MGSDFEVFLHATTKRKLAYSEYCHAGAELRNAQIWERRAELRSQSFTSINQGKLHAIVGDLGEKERNIALALIDYVVIGRADTDQPSGKGK